jgi:hypothetical protein
MPFFISGRKDLRKNKDKIVGLCKAAVIERVGIIKDKAGNVNKIELMRRMRHSKQLINRLSPTI